MPQSLNTLITTLDQLRDELTTAEKKHAGAIDAVGRPHRRGAVNLVDYSALRHHDRRELQNDLLDIGVTSLSTTEANVRAKLQAVRTGLAALRGDGGPWNLDAITDAIKEGDDILAANSDAVFGPMRPDRPTRVMVTLPSEAADDPALVAALLDAGMDIARINCAHDDPGAWGRMAANVRTAADAAGRPVAISMDLPGPKLRTGPILDGPAVGRARVTRDESGQPLVPARIWLTPIEAPAPAVEPPSPRPALVVQVDRAWLEGRRVGDLLTTHDARGPRRTFTVTTVGDGGALAVGEHSTYLASGATLTCRGQHTIVAGIPPVSRVLALARGARLVLTADLTPVAPPTEGQVARIGCTLPEAIAALRAGDPVLFDDGTITAEVESMGRREATLRIVHTRPGGQHLGAEKGINVPTTVLSVNALTADDEAHLPFIAATADMVAVSFVRTADDVKHVLARLHAAGGDHLGLVLKIETRQGFENLPAILLVAMRHPRLAVMIARGDLAVEIGFERLADVPRQILALCEAAHVPTIWATQVLENLAKTGQPSRAEITDAAYAQRAECVMLNKGPHIVDAIRALDNILARMGQVQRKSRALMRHIHSWDAQ